MMRCFFLLTLAALAPLVHPFSARAATLTVTPDGVSINAGLMGEFNWAVPALMMRPDDYTGEKAAVTVSDPTHLSATYPCGATLQIAITGEQLVYSYSQVPQTACAFRVSMLIPLKFNKGGKFSFEDALAASFPAEKDKTFLYHDNGTIFRLTDSLGNALDITRPFGWQELADNRAYGWDVFCYTASFPLDGTGQGGLSIGIASAASGGTGKISGFLLDRYGQIAAKSYPGKVSTDQQLKADITDEKSYLDSLTEAPVDTYGGLPGSHEKYQLKTTGFFHTETASGHQFLVDPEGNLFYSLGVCTMQPLDDYTLVRGREQVYEFVPSKVGEFSSVWRRDDDRVMSFYLLNWVRKFGCPFDLEKWSDQSITRLRRWGFNTAGAFGAETAAMQKRHFATTPLLPLEAEVLTKMQGIDRMYDPFAPGTAETIDKLFAAQIAPAANDPTIIGYFLGNEQLFENIPKLVPAQKSDSPSKLRLVRLLQERYASDIGKFDAAWAPKQSFANFDELKDASLFVTTAAAAEDLREFQRLYLEEHYATVNRIFRKYDPNHQLLGSRWQPGTSNNEMLVRIASKYMDVISVNYYTYAIEESFLQKIENWSSGKPMFLSEWHYTCGDQGLSGGQELASQHERGLAYRNYVETTAGLPYVVGEQWFSYLDQSATGRWFEGFNGEGANIGLINVVDRAYTDFVAECKQTNDAIYRILLGALAPYHSADSRFSATHEGGQKMLVIPRALPGLKLDGSTQRWPGRPPEALTPANLALGDKEDDFGASFRLCYDDANLYVIAEVKDKTPLLNPNSADTLYQGDCLELFIGPDNVQEGGALKFSDRQILIGASTFPKYFVFGSLTQPTDLKTLAAKNALGDGYTLETAIPWADLGFKPENGQEILFDLGINGTSDPSPTRTKRNSQWIWNGNARDSGDRGQWGRARFQNN